VFGSTWIHLVVWPNVPKRGTGVGFTRSRPPGRLKSYEDPKNEWPAASEPSNSAASSCPTDTFGVVTDRADVAERASTVKVCEPPVTL
jgi:hypothetical protein